MFPGDRHCSYIMTDDPCKALREVYDSCFQEWVDKEYFTGNVKGPMTPCEGELGKYHECMRGDPRRKKYIENLEEYKKQFPR